jgi:hypothetical protein
MYSELVLHTKMAMTGQKVLLFFDTTNIVHLFSCFDAVVSFLHVKPIFLTFGLACDFDIRARHDIFCE